MLKCTLLMILFVQKSLKISQVTLNTTICYNNNYNVVNQLITGGEQITNKLTPDI